MTLQETPVHLGDLQLYPEHGQAFQGERNLYLTKIEFQYLHYLTQHQGRVVGHIELAEAIRQTALERWEAQEDARYYIHCIRKKIEPNPGQPCYIHTIRGYGYKAQWAQV